MTTVIDKNIMIIGEVLYYPRFILHLCMCTVSTESLASKVSVPASASSWGQSVGQVWLGGSSRGFASKLCVHNTNTERNSLHCSATQSIDHSKYSGSNSLFLKWECFYLSQMAFK